MSEFLGLIGLFFTQSMTWMGDVLNKVAGSPPLAILVLAMPILGFSVGLLKRLISL